jgi:hypothetical protein
LIFSAFFSCTENKVLLLPLDAEFPPILEGEISRSITLQPFPDSTPYKLRGYLRVKSGATLTILPGTIIEAESADEAPGIAAIVVEPGGQLWAVGEAGNPIMFTCAEKRRGKWGGIVMMGKAPVNSDGVSRIDTALGIYGGVDINDNSGFLKYVVIEYAGYKKRNSAELSGLTLLGVGRNTKIDHVFVRESGNDGVALFGGTVDLTHLLVKNCSDDLFDWTEGWQGRGQFWIGHFCESDPEEHGRGIEAQSFNDAPGAVTINAALESKAKLYNVSILGDPKTEDRSAVQVKSGWISLNNTVILDFDLGAIQLDSCGAQGSIKISGLLLHDSKVRPAPLYVKSCSAYPTLSRFSLLPDRPLANLSDCNKPDYTLLKNYAAAPFSSLVVDPSVAEAGGPDQSFFRRALFFGGDDGMNWTSWTNKYNR